MNLDDELIQAFLEESTENLDQLDLDLVALEAIPDDPELLDRVFRTIHTIKGTCGFLNYGRLEALSHAGEDLLAALRDGLLRLDAPITSSLLHLVDEIRGVLSVVEADGTEGESDHAEVIAELRGHLLRQHGPSDAPPPRADPTPPATPVPTPTAHEDASVRIDVSVLDRLQDLVGELTLARLRVGDFVPDEGEFAQAYRQLTVTTREIQEAVMQARLQPVSTVTDRLRRIVRDLATQVGKQVRLQIDGEDVSVDKAINETLRDPLVHLVRNAVDHGIETPDERLAMGKPQESVLLIQAAVAGGGVQIDVTDDGRGIDGVRLVDRAIANGSVSAQAAAGMTDAQRMSLVFLPGVSTAAEVTTVSGRGVGMDVVRANLEQVGGSVDVWSEPGVGTTFRINVPLTLAILPAIIVTCGDSHYAIPQADVQAIVTVPAEDLDDRIRRVGTARFLRHHGTLLPLVDLASYLGVETLRADKPLEVVVIHRLERVYGLVVDSVGDNVEAVVKPLPRRLRGLTCYAGVTVLSDGRPSLILETSAPAAEADVHPQPDESTQPAPARNPAETGLLTVAVGDNRVAVILNVVQRLTRAAAVDIEHSGHDEVVQHQGRILPLIRVGSLLDLTPSSDDEFITIVVCATREGSVGLVVDEILDIQWADLRSAEPVDDPFLTGRLVVANAATEILDVEQLVARGLHQHRPATGDRND